MPPFEPKKTIGYHNYKDLVEATNLVAMIERPDSKTIYKFENFFHPFVGELIEKLNKDSLPGLLDPKFHEELNSHAAFSDNLRNYYTQNPLGDENIKAIIYDKKIDVSTGGPYANYHWELFFHIPLSIAVHLSKNQRFAEAQRWFHFIFDPTCNDTSLERPQRFWKFLAFRQGSAGQQIDDMLRLLSTPDDELANDEEAQKKKEMIREGYKAIKDKPFQPHAVARTRHLAYMYSVVMKYLDNLIAWGDHLFRQDTLETINEATQIYVLAANILGQRPQKIPLKGKVRPKTFAQLKKRGLDEMGNALVELEGLLAFNSGLPGGSGASNASAPLFGMGRTLYFCIPRNEKLLTYWDTVSDRLFKIRHCMNIEGTVRKLALFEPPLDPGMLVKAAAAGIDIGSAVAGLRQPASPVRARVLIQKALELSAEVRSLGSSLLQAIEKEDSENLALIRSEQEVKIQELQQEVRFLQWKQAEEATESLLKSRAVVLERYKYFLRLLGQKAPGKLAPDVLPLKREVDLTEESFDEAYEALVGQYDKEVPVLAYPPLSLEGGGSPSDQAGAKGSGKFAITTGESDEIRHLEAARDNMLAASIARHVASAFGTIPDVEVNLHYWGIGGTIDLPIGTLLRDLTEITADGLSMKSSWERDQAGLASRDASYELRASDRIQQVNSAALELRQIGRQILSSLIAEHFAKREYEITQQQIKNSKQIDRELRDKFTNAELYGWMHGELSGLYYEYYRFAFDVARSAEQAMKRELMRPELEKKTLVKYNYWDGDGGRKGLLSGEALYLDVKRMEMAYHEHNVREYELTKHVSVLQVDPVAIVNLRSTGRCTVRLPESIFDLDGPGQYFRRIKTVALSIPCVTGPYASINCKLTLLKNSIRTTALLNGDYSRDPSGDSRFEDYHGSLESIVASSAQQDSGLFETNLADERYLPFERAGAISEWQLELPANPSDGDPALFDYDTIADVVLSMRYTARDGGSMLRKAALQEVKHRMKDADSGGFVRLFSVRHEFPTEWARFHSQECENDQKRELAVTFHSEHYPFWCQGFLNDANVESVDLFAKSDQESLPASIEIADRDGMNKSRLQRFPDLNDLFVGKSPNVPKTTTSELKLCFSNGKLSDLFIAVKWIAA